MNFFLKHKHTIIFAACAYIALAAVTVFALLIQDYRVDFQLMLPSRSILLNNVLLIFVMVVISYLYFKSPDVNNSFVTGLKLGGTIMVIAVILELLIFVPVVLFLELMPAEIKSYYLTHPLIWLEVALILLIPSIYGTL